jgi:hypothetical protein
MIGKLPFLLIAAVLLTGGASAESLPLTLKIWSVNEAHAITCTGKSWIEVPAGAVRRQTVLAAIPGAKPLSVDQKLLACDNGTGADATITGDVSQVRMLHAGQTVVQGNLRILVLRYPAPQNTLSSIIFAVDSALGDDAFLSKSGKGLIRLDHENGIAVYPPSYQLQRVVESSLYVVPDPPKPPTPCTITYLADDPGATPKKVIRSHLDCATLIHQTPTDNIFAGDIPQQF